MASVPARLQSASLFSHSHLVYFVRVAEEGQISRAARTLYMAQPALSQAIARLERQLGFDLLVRHPTGVTLTPAGEVFLQKAMAVIEANDSAAALARSLVRSSRGMLELGFLSTPPSLIAPRLLEDFAQARPDVEVYFRELPLPAGPLADWLAEVDVAISYSPLPGAGFASETLWSEPRALMVHRGNPLACDEDVSVAEVLDEPFCGYHSAINTEWSAFWTLDDHRGGPPGRVTGDRACNVLELVAALAAGHGVAIAPATVALTLARVAPHLAARTITDAAPCSCSLVWRSPPANPLTLEFVRTARARLCTHGENAA